MSVGFELDPPPFDVECLDVEVDVDAEYEPEPETLDAIRDHAEWFDTLPPERQAEELNHCSSLMESSEHYIVIDGEPTVEGSTHADLLKQRAELRLRREAEIASKRTRLTGIVTPVACRLARDRAPRSRRTRTGSHGCRSPGRSTDDDDEPADPLDVGKSA
jgi:hypothetical protein